MTPGPAVDGDRSSEEEEVEDEDDAVLVVARVILGTMTVDVVLTMVIGVVTLVVEEVVLTAVVFGISYNKLAHAGVTVQRGGDPHPKVPRG